MMTLQLLGLHLAKQVFDWDGGLQTWDADLVFSSCQWPVEVHSIIATFRRGLRLLLGGQLTFGDLLSD